jgi:outer membrane protein assembly factor BamA
VAAALLALSVAGPARGDGAALIRGIEIEGNRRTEGDLVRSAMGVAPGDPFDPDSLPRLEQRVRNLRLFTAVHVAPVPDGPGSVVLRVTVQERWTLIPIPIFTASSGGTGGGLYLLESNLFGRGKVLGVGGMITTQGNSVSALYRDRGVLETPLLFSAEFARADMTRQQDAGGTAVYAFQDRRYDFGAMLGWRISDWLAVRAGWFELLVRPGAALGFVPPPAMPDVRGLSAELELRDEDYHLYYLTGLALRVRYRQGVSWLGSGRGLHQGSAAATWATEGFSDHARAITAAVETSRGDAVVDALRLGGRPGSRGFVQGRLWAESAATTTVEYQVPVWRPSWGVLTTAIFTDAGLTRWRGAETDYVAAGLGFRTYLRDVAIPALGLDVAQATGMSAPTVSVHAGFRF